MTRIFRRIAVYCGSSNNVADTYKDAARELGILLAKSGIAVVYGGGNVGLMGICADAALAAGGDVIGVIPHKLEDLEVGHTGLTEKIVVDSMHARKMVMASLSDAFIAMPGGFGTMDELVEITTWNQLGYHQKPAGVLNVRGYFDSFLAFVRHAGEEGFIRPIHRGLLVDAETPPALLDALQTQEMPDLTKWLERP
ncbi:MAG: TIGR00730 family Rossman fold protein [Myxococcota bacterium]